ncbi:MAG: LamG domain-containing protein [Pseudomonadota bacterium]
MIANALNAGVGSGWTMSSNRFLRAALLVTLAVILSACELENESLDDTATTDDPVAGGTPPPADPAPPSPPPADPPADPPAPPPPPGDPTPPPGDPMPPPPPGDPTPPPPPGDPTPPPPPGDPTPPPPPGDPTPPPPPGDPTPPPPPGDPMPPPPPMPPPGDPAPPPAPPSAEVQLFEQTLYPHLADPNNFCVACHGVTQIPTFSVADVTSAYNALVSQQKVNLNNPELSRVYLRSAIDRHNCGGDMICDRIAMDMLAAINDWQTLIAASNPTPPGGGGTAGPVVSGMLKLADGVAAAAARADDAVIAKFNFEEGAGDVAMDTSGVGTPIALNIEGMEWVAGGGLRNISGKAQASLDDSRKLFDMITPQGAYTVEAWVITDDVAQDGPARVVSYSQDTGTRNFTLGQNAIYYQLRNRSANTGQNGTPALEAENTQVDTVLQHVVMTFDEAEGRKVYINGQLDIEENTADTLAWTDDQIFVIGNEVTNDRLWQGTFKLVAIHNKALSSLEVAQNYDAGTDRFVTLTFDLTDMLGAPAAIEIQAAQLDPAAYVFTNPTFIGDAANVRIKNVRIAINGAVPVASQMFRRLDTTVVQAPMLLSAQGAVIPLALGAENDDISLEFEILGNNTGLAEAVAPSNPPIPTPDEPEPDLGMRTFSQVNDTMSLLTGVPATNNAVRNAYSDLRDSLPPTADLNAFGGTQQIAIQNLAKAYCGVLVGNNGTCTDFFGSCEIAAGDKAQVAATVYSKLIGDNLVNQPDLADVSTELVSLIDDVGCDGGCNGAAAEVALQATCTAALASAAVSIN